MGLLDESDLQLLWLPLAHAFGKVLIATQVACGFATAIDGRVDKIVENCGWSNRPSWAPRRASSRRPTTKSSPQQKGAQSQSCSMGVRGGQRGRPPTPRRQVRVAAPGAATEAVRRAGVRQDPRRIRRTDSVLHLGSAPLNRDIAEWFEAAGVLVLEGYGLTESSGAGFINRPDNYKLGTVGLPFEGTEVRISDAGEVQFRSDCVMAGYHHLDDATAEALTRTAGWPPAIRASSTTTAS